ncbi:MAG: hypothetical protein IJ873_05665 [Lachnospiraceae bacterium]|nr:hypothetical protein [Lachnospiraceae bacterium]MBR2275536.1 hypothetical protein [Lachnospiraceae bacterium]
MKSMLYNLFDYQKFAQNKELAEVIEGAGTGTSRKKGNGKIKKIPLSDEALQYAAAGVSQDPVTAGGPTGSKSAQMMTIVCQFCPTSFEVDIQKPGAVCPKCGKYNKFSG